MGPVQIERGGPRTHIAPCVPLPERGQGNDGPVEEEDNEDCPRSVGDVEGNHGLSETTVSLCAVDSTGMAKGEMMLLTVDGKVQDNNAICDPLEGHDAEFDVELSSSSSAGSLSLSSGFYAESSGEDNDDHGHNHKHEQGHFAQHLQQINTDKMDSSGYGGDHGTLYGKMFKTLRLSIRKLFHCVRTPDRLTEAAIGPCDAECFGERKNVTSSRSTINSKSKMSKRSTIIPPTPTTPSSDVPLSPITSITNSCHSPQDLALVATHHQTLLIDVAYSRPLLGALQEQDLPKKCLVLDLDETLVHSSFQPVSKADLIVPVHLGDGVYQPIYVCKRPGVDAFLQRMSELFEVYADPVIDFLDPRGAIRSRLYRDSCIQFQGMYIKDLSRLGRDLAQVLIVDNSPASYSMQPNNALACRSWFSDPLDHELDERLLPILIKLAEASSVPEWRRLHLDAIETPYCCRSSA